MNRNLALVAATIACMPILFVPVSGLPPPVSDIQWNPRVGTLVLYGNSSYNPSTQMTKETVASWHISGMCFPRVRGAPVEVSMLSNQTNRMPRSGFFRESPGDSDSPFPWRHTIRYPVAARPPCPDGYRLAGTTWPTSVDLQIYDRPIHDVVGDPAYNHQRLYRTVEMA